MKEKLIERLVRYAKIDTQSDATSSTTPTTPDNGTFSMNYKKN